MSFHIPDFCYLVPDKSGILKIKVFGVFKHDLFKFPYQFLLFFSVYDIIPAFDNFNIKFAPFLFFLDFPDKNILE